jgi:hypothetical protein
VKKISLMFIQLSQTGSLNKFDENLREASRSTTSTGNREAEIGPLLGFPDGTSEESAKLPEVATAQCRRRENSLE